MDTRTELVGAIRDLEQQLGQHPAILKLIADARKRHLNREFVLHPRVSRAEGNTGHLQVKLRLDPKSSTSIWKVNTDGTQRLVSSTAMVSPPFIRVEVKCSAG